MSLASFKRPLSQKIRASSLALLVHELALGMSAQELTAVVRAWQNGAISRETMLPLFRRSEILPEGRTDHPCRTCQSGLAGRGFISTTQARAAETALGGTIAAGDAADFQARAAVDAFLARFVHVALGTKPICRFTS
jgi:hypothetical protein